MDGFGALDVATAAFSRTLRSVPDNGWTAATPNPGWSVRDLVNHVVGGNRRYVLLLSGASTDEVEALRDLDHLSDDPVTDFLSTAAEVTAAFCRPGALDRVVHHRKGDRTGSDLLVMRVMEHALHGWDLAQAINSDDTIDPPVAEFLLASIGSDPAWLAEVGYVSLAGSDALTGSDRLLALTGRSRHRR